MSRVSNNNVLNNIAVGKNYIKNNNYIYKLIKDINDNYILTDSDGNSIIFEIKKFDPSEDSSEQEFYNTYLKEIIDNNLEPQDKDKNFIFNVKANNFYYLYVYNDKKIQKRMGSSGLSSVTLDKNKSYTVVNENNYNTGSNVTILNANKHSQDGGRRHRSYNYRGHGGNGSTSDLIPDENHGLKDLYNNPDKEKTPEELILMTDYVTNNFDKLKLYTEINNNDELKNFINIFLIKEYLESLESNK